MRLLPLLVALVAGCATTKPASFSGREIYSQNLVAKYSNGTYPLAAYTNKYFRNQLIDDLVLLINDNYSEYERSFYSNNAFANTASDLVVLGLSSAATVVGGEGVKTALAATITGISGAKMSVSKEFFAEQSRIALIAKMRALRIQKMAEIEEHKKHPITDYPLSRALLDVQDLAECGTLVSGLQGLVEQSSASLANAKENFLRATQKGE